MSKSKIEWCDRVWNPVTGCTRVSPGCDNCYAIRQSHRFSSVPGKFSGTTVRVARLHEGIDWSGKVTCHEDLLAMPLRWKKPSRVFVNSMSDLFHDDVPIGFIAKVWATMASSTLNCRHPFNHEDHQDPGSECWSGQCHTYLILTKRPMRMKMVLNSDEFNSAMKDLIPWDPGYPLPNVWLGVSCENQAMADQRIPHLLKTPAAVRFVSYEPALEAVDFSEWLKVHALGGDLPKFTENTGEVSLLDWIICGGESGPGARPMNPAWARSVRDQCKAAGVAFFFKQWGEYLHESQFADIAPEHCGGNYGFARVGKKQAGDALDYVQHHEWPEAKA